MCIKTSTQLGVFSINDSDKYEAHVMVVPLGEHCSPASDDECQVTELLCVG